MQKIHMIGNAHIDPVWLWTRDEGYAEIRATFRSALDRLKEYPDFVFTCAGAGYYKWIEEIDPDMFEEIRSRVREGRWVIVGGMWLQPDCNIPCGESFARQMLYSQRYFLEKFGRIATVGYNVDSFGHNGMLPQLLRQGGMDSYVFMRPSDHEKAGVPNLFTWESPDGSRVRAFKIHESYTLPSPETLSERADGMRHIAEKIDAPIMLFYGVGNHGGGPTIRLLDAMEREMETAMPDLTYSSPDAYFRAVGDRALPVIADELQIHAIGCYTAHLPIKQAMRRTEDMLLRAEKASVLAKVLTGHAYPAQTIRDAWEEVLFNQFHDILCGCCIRQAYDDALRDLGYSGHIAKKAEVYALQKITSRIDTLGDDKLPHSKEEDWKTWGLAKRGTPFVVFNFLSSPVHIPVEAGGTLASVTDCAGRELAVQRVRSTVTNGENDKYNTLFLADIPAMGYATFYLHGHEKLPAQTYPETEEIVLENMRLQVRFDRETGLPCQMLDKETGRDALKGAMRLLVMDETHSDTWGHGLFEYRDTVDCFRMEKAIVVENGPVRQKVRVTLAAGASRVEADFALLCDAKHVDIALRIDWHEKHRMLKLECPVNAQTDTYEAEIPYGRITRAADGKEKPMQRYLRVRDEKGGLILVNDSVYGADVKDNVIRQTLLRSPIFADHFGSRDELCEFTAQGETFMKLRMAAEDGKADPAWHAEELNTVFPFVTESYHKGDLSEKVSMLEMEDGSVRMTSLKEAEDGNGLIARFVETQGREAETKVAFPALGQAFSVKLRPFEIATRRIPFDKNGQITRTDFLERE